MGSAIVRSPLQRCVARPRPMAPNLNVGSVSMNLCAMPESLFPITVNVIRDVDECALVGAVNERYRVIVIARF